MSNEVMVPMKDQRDIQTVTTEIRTLHRQAQRMILGYAIEIGRRLTEAKEMLPHGQWGDWLKTEVEFSQSTAQNFMRIFAEYGDSQTSLFGDAKSQTLGNLPYTHALKLLAVPAEEREEFVEAHHVDELSSRELEKLIRERDEARAAQAALEEEAAAAAFELEDMKEKLEGAERDLEAAETAWKAEEAAMQAEVEKAKAEAEKRLADAAAAAESAKKAKEKLKQLQENPEVPAEVLEKLKGEAAEAAQKELNAARAEAEAKVREAVQAAQAAAQRAEAAEKKLRTADAETAAFKARFVDIQRAFATLREMRQAADEEKAAGMARAVRALLEQEKGLWA